ncbi:MAG: GyrI-like domain-containing protein [Chloroflexi bacterium]|nr:MAG: GyrI-like domain-containing protein [Chloroflexota bacterium]
MSTLIDNIRLEERRPAMNVAMMRAKVPATNGGEVMGPMVQDILAYIEGAAIQRTGVPYPKTSWAPGSEIEVGIPVARGIVGNERVRPAELPACRAAVLWFTGPYDRLGPVIGAAYEWIEEHSLKADLPWEFYHSNPTIDTDPSKYRTELVFPVRER